MGCTVRQTDQYAFVLIRGVFVQVPGRRSSTYALQ